MIEFIKGPSGIMLKELIMDNCIHINIKGLQEVPKYCPNLEIFVFYNCDCSEGKTRWSYTFRVYWRRRKFSTFYVPVITVPNFYTTEN